MDQLTINRFLAGMHINLLKHLLGMVLQIFYWIFALIICLIHVTKVHTTHQLHILQFAGLIVTKMQQYAQILLMLAHLLTDLI